ncbi:MAG: helix-turn-helix transcriptional regulator [Patescibacteria group bacterium]
MKKQTIKFISHKDFKKELFKDPEFRKVHNEMAFELEIFKALIRARIEKKLTQKQLATKIGVAQSALARFENGNTNPTLSFLKKVTTGLGLKLMVK